MRFRARSLGVAVLVSLSVGLSLAQSRFLEPLQRSREFNRQAQAAATAGRWADARSLTQQALTQRPGHPTLLYNLAALQARLGEEKVALETLRHLAEAGLAYAPALDADFQALRPGRRFRRLTERFEENRAPRVASTAAWRLTEVDRDFQAEGLAVAAGGTELFLGSVRRGEILWKTPGKITPILTPARGSVLSLAVDEGRRRLWAGLAVLPESEKADPARRGRAALACFDLEAVSWSEVILLPEGSVPGSLTVSPGGAVFASDSAKGALFRVSAGTDRLETLLAAGHLASPQGIALASDGQRLFVADFALGLFVVDLISGRLEPLAAPGPVGLPGVDGLVRHGAALIALQSGVRPNRVLRLRLDPAEMRIESVETLESAHPEQDEPAGTVLAGEDLFYVANGQWGKFEGGRAPDLEECTPPVVLKLPLPPLDAPKPERKRLPPPIRPL